jgi:hypothetical protein
VYRRLADEGLTSVLGCEVPEMLRHDDDLWAIEMSIVKPPFVLDFAGPYLDVPPDYPDAVLADWDREKADQFGSHWPMVQAVLRALEAHGVFLLDVSPGNIRVDEPPRGGRPITDRNAEDLDPPGSPIVVRIGA